ncbi:Uncharacterized protein RNJ44_03852 [Nakaseomyces bracarensis]|uniref:Dilute domain-containing protein n=1 Tax=Nakaseomyces bracarensis TaxID=273131 RepID=A0ABR4NYM6_9SACH
MDNIWDDSPPGGAPGLEREVDQHRELKLDLDIDGNGDSSAKDKAEVVRRAVDTYLAGGKGGDMFELVQLVSDETRGEEFTTFKTLLEGVQDVNDKSVLGVPLLHLTIIYDRASYIEFLYQKARSQLDFNLYDDLVGYTPLMWCFLMERTDCCTELFTWSSEIDFQKTSRDERITAWEMISPVSSFHMFLEQNNMLQYQKIPQYNEKLLNNNKSSEGGLDEQALRNIDLHIAGMSLAGSKEGQDIFASEEPETRHDVMFGTERESNGLYEEFDFSKLQPNQYLEFEEFDITQLLNILESLPKREPHLTTYAAAFIFQLVRYAEHKKKNPQLVHTILSLSMTRILSSITTETDMSQENADAAFSSGDIVLQSYWLGVLTFLYYYLTRDESFFKKYPAILQELINTIHAVIIELTLSIHSRLTSLIQPTLLSYTTISDVKQTLYKRDWNFFKKRRHQKMMQKQKKLQEEQERMDALGETVEENKEKTEDEPKDKKSKRKSFFQKKRDSKEFHPTKSNETKDENASINEHDMFYDTEIIKHLYPPSMEEQMKPSPMKIVQIFGALMYVLNLHQIHPVFQQQCMSLAIQWFSINLFNQILKDKKKKSLSRAHAIQIRLNLSTFESWAKNNDLQVPKPQMIDDFMWERFPYTLVEDVANIDLSQPPLKNVATVKKVDKTASGDLPIVYDTDNSLFFYQSLHRIVQIHMEPVFQLLQWLQVATTLDTEDVLNSTMELLPRLTPAQLLKVVDKYSYEVDESKFSSKLRKKLSTLAKSVNNKESAYLQERVVSILTLPTVPEMTDIFARGPGHESYQPLLPISIQDDVYEIHSENVKLRQNHLDYYLSSHNNSDEENEANVEENSNDLINMDSHQNENYTPEDISSNYLAADSTQNAPAWSATEEFEENPW